jgi:hypothetical protein
MPSRIQGDTLDKYRTLDLRAPTNKWPGGDIGTGDKSGIDQGAEHGNVQIGHMIGHDDRRVAV